jgi:hypothetical protein
VVPFIASFASLYFCCIGFALPSQESHSVDAMRSLSPLQNSLSSPFGLLAFRIWGDIVHASGRWIPKCGPTFLCSQGKPELYIVLQLRLISYRYSSFFFITEPSRYGLYRSATEGRKCASVCSPHLWQCFGGSRATPKYVLELSQCGFRQRISNMFGSNSIGTSIKPLL